MKKKNHCNNCCSFMNFFFFFFFLFFLLIFFNLRVLSRHLFESLDNVSLNRPTAEKGNFESLIGLAFNLLSVKVFDKNRKI